METLSHKITFYVSQLMSSFQGYLSIFSKAHNRLFKWLNASSMLNLSFFEKKTWISSNQNKFGYLTFNNMKDKNYFIKMTKSYLSYLIFLHSMLNFLSISNLLSPSLKRQNFLRSLKTSKKLTITSIIFKSQRDNFKFYLHRKFCWFFQVHSNNNFFDCTRPFW